MVYTIVIAIKRRGFHKTPKWIITQIINGNYKISVKIYQQKKPKWSFIRRTKRDDPQIEAVIKVTKKHVNTDSYGVTWVGLDVLRLISDFFDPTVWDRFPDGSLRARPVACIRTDSRPRRPPGRVPWKEPYDAHFPPFWGRQITELCKWLQLAWEERDGQVDQAPVT